LGPPYHSEQTRANQTQAGRQAGNNSCTETTRKGFQIATCLQVVVDLARHHHVLDDLALAHAARAQVGGEGGELLGVGVGGEVGAQQGVAAAVPAEEATNGDNVVVKRGGLDGARVAVAALHVDRRHRPRFEVVDLHLQVPRHVVLGEAVVLLELPRRQVRGRQRRGKLDGCGGFWLGAVQVSARRGVETARRQGTKASWVGTSRAVTEGDRIRAVRTLACEKLDSKGAGCKAV
jgi:hypothetical protein